jgi:hypothetical protein
MGCLDKIFSLSLLNQAWKIPGKSGDWILLLIIVTKDW